VTAGLRSATPTAMAPPSEWPTSVQWPTPVAASPCTTASAYALIRWRMGPSEAPSPGTSIA
jgi:hypothetical protein